MSLVCLHGIPICVKDLELTKGLRTALGCSAFKDWVPDFDSAVVERLRAANAVILGKTNTPEFGNSAETFTDIFPTANNPWDVTRHPGGSSGGTSAAIASGMCSLGTGTDGGGSVRHASGVYRDIWPQADSWANPELRRSIHAVVQLHQHYGANVARCPIVGDDAYGDLRTRSTRPRLPEDSCPGLHLRARGRN